MVMEETYGQMQYVPRSSIALGFPKVSPLRQHYPAAAAFHLKM